MATKTAGKTDGSIFEWKIKNISHCWLKLGKRIVSPSFIVDMLEGTKWSLWLYPFGDINECYVGVYLHRKDGSIGPNPPEIQFQIAFLGEDGSLLKERTANSKFKENNSWGFSEFEKRKLIFVTYRDVFLPDDTLTVQCMVWIKKRPVKPKLIYSETVYTVNRRSFVWRIIDFSTMKSDVRNEFKDVEIDFDLVLSDGLDLEKKLLLNIDSFDEDMKYFSFKISVIDSEGKREDFGTHEYFLNDLKKEVISTLLFTKKFLDYKSRYLLNDALSLDCEYVYSDGSVLYEYCVCGRISPKLNDEIVENSTKHNSENEDSLSPTVLVNDLKFMYDDAICSDIELRTSMQTYPAHKNILSARSPLFRSLFSNDMKERNCGYVDITDFEDDIVQRMLLYIYTDNLEDIEIESASKLYAVADKYQILSLRNKCSSFLKDNLCLKRVCDVLVLADLHHDEDLKTCVEDYILGQRKLILSSQEWKNFMNTHLKIAANVMYKISNQV